MEPYSNNYPDSIGDGGLHNLEYFSTPRFVSNVATMVWIAHSRSSFLGIDLYYHHHFQCHFDFNFGNDTFCKQFEVTYCNWQINWIERKKFRKRKIPTSASWKKFCKLPLFICWSFKSIKSQDWKVPELSSTDKRETKLPFVPKIERKNEEEIQYFEPRKRLHSRHKKEPKNFFIANAAASSCRILTKKKIPF